MRRVRVQTTKHGTAFAYRQAGGETLLLTNEHVGDAPAVTSADHAEGNVPQGCKRVGESIRIVDDESDSYARDDVPLTLVVADVQLDAAVLRAKAALPVMPWKIGRSATLRERNAVVVRGFPLAAFRATNVGKVISAHDHDDEKDWDHDDFVIDAQLSEGNSGSPVLALSCKTGEYQLVGLFHAAYTGGSSLNVVVGIDQLRDLMTTLKRSPRTPAVPEMVLDEAARARLVGDVKALPDPFFSFGGRVAAARLRPDGVPLFELFSSDFPRVTSPVFAFADFSGVSGFDERDGIWFGSGRGLKRRERSELDGEAQAQVTHLVDALRRDALAHFDWQLASRRPGATRQEAEKLDRIEKSLKRTAASRRDIVQAAGDLSERFAPDDSEAGMTLVDVLAAPRGVSSAPAAPPAAGPVKPSADAKRATSTK